MEDDLGLSRWVHFYHNSPYKRDSGGVSTGGEGDVMMKAGTGVMCFDKGRRGYTQAIEMATR